PAQLRKAPGALLQPPQDQRLPLAAENLDGRLHGTVVGLGSHDVFSRFGRALPILFESTLLHCPYFPSEGQGRRIPSSWRPARTDWWQRPEPAAPSPIVSCPSATEPPMTEVTPILAAIEDGEPCGAEQLLPLVYDELRRLAAQK